MFENRFLGNTIEHWGISILIIVGVFIFVRLVSLIGARVVLPLIRKTKSKFGDIIYNSLRSPLLFGIMLLGIWIAVHQLTYTEQVSKAINNAYAILVLLNITWFFAKLTSGLLTVYWAGGANQRMLPIVKRSLLVVVWIIGGVMALSNVGINISALLGTLGIGGIAFALAAQDTVKNIFGAFTILTDKPFSIGDIVQIDPYEGTIIDVGIRSTKIRNYDGRIVTIPNHKVADASVVNISTEETYRRVTVKLGVTYDTTPQKMQEAIRILKNMPSKVEFVKKDDTTVFFSEFADSAMIVTFIYFIDKKGGIQQVTSNVNMEILQSFNEAGLSFAFPSQTLYIEKGD